MRKKNNKIIGKISLSSSINYPIVNISTNQGNKSYGEKIVHKRAKSTNKFRYIKNTQNINLIILTIIIIIIILIKIII